ncbi:MAG TPA: hypothetical protein VK912_05600 [Longimicrobiales bacterium]|nr:hypothetical protein [Longimicrobiales bacterium]
MKATLWLPAVMVLAGFAATWPASPRKCTMPVLFRDAPEPAFVLDGDAADADVMRQLEAEQVESIDIMCAPELYEIYQVKAQRSGVVIFTRPGPVAQLQSSLDELQALQRSYFEAHGVFSSDLEQLGWADETGLITMDLSVQDGGSRWKATASHRYRPRLSSQRSVSADHAHGPAKNRGT